MTQHGPWALIGGGNMGRAMLAGVMGSWPSTRVMIAEPDAVAASLCRTIVGPDDVVSDAAAAIERLDALCAGTDHARRDADAGPIVLAVKPQMLTGVAERIRPVLRDRPRVVVSILAGTPGATVRDVLGPEVRVVRAMPNLAATVGHSCSAVCLSAGAHPGDEDFAVDLFESIGPRVARIPEAMMDAFTAVAGSGPAYLFYLAEAMEKGAVEVGFSPEQARAIVTATLRGAAAMLDGQSPGEKRAAVTSKGGTTAAAIAVLEQSGRGGGGAGVSGEVVRAVVAARDRGRALSSC